MAPHNVLLVTSHLNVRNCNDPLFAGERARITKPLISPHGIVAPSKRSDCLHSTTPTTDLVAGNNVSARTVDDELLERAQDRSCEMSGVVARLREYLSQVEADSNISSNETNWDEDSCYSSSSSESFTTSSSEGDPKSETSEVGTFRDTESDDELPILDDDTIPSVSRAF